MTKSKHEDMTSTGSTDDCGVSGGCSIAGKSVFDSSSSSDSTGRAASYSAPVVGKKEQKFVFLSKILVAVVLTLAVCALATTAYALVTEEEKNNFESQFEAYASEIVTVARQKADQMFSSLDSFSVSIASQAISEQLASNKTWPFVTLPHYSLKAEKLKNVMGANSSVILFSPIVEESEKAAWSAYVSEEAPAWYQESIDNEERNYTVPDLMTKTLPFIHFYDPANGFMPTPVARPGAVLPVWQTYPFETDPINPLMATNYDLLTGQRISDLFRITSDILGPSIGITQVVTARDTMSAQSQIMQPVFRGVDTDAEGRELVGMVWVRMEWKDYFQNLLIEGVDGISVVLKSSCPKVDALSRTVLEEVGVMTYEINGPNAQLLNETDTHDPKYEYLAVSSVLVDLEVDSASLSEGQCVPKLTMHVYPSQAMEDSFYTSRPIIFMAIVIVIFVFTTIVFLLYDFFVGRQQRKFLDRIVQQDKIVTNVFPTAIRDRLYANNDEANKSQTDLFDPLDYEDGQSNVVGGAPLADLFPNTTVVFADIAGFTAWSSAREPHQVFKLLETIYGAFDKIAYRHNVFKIETVGDCFVAVAGLPEPNKQHALCVAKFARDCLKKMKELVVMLEVTLGPDTADLELRIGIHSGQVTAGVLRGDRSRFQLFGDTVNTASRMESGGEKGRIQISQATADLLKKSGLGKTLVAREKKIFVKGKGDMQTYWIRTDKKSGAFKRSLDASRASEMTTLAESDDDTESSQSDTDEDGLHLETEGVKKMSKTDRLVEWNAEVLCSLLQQIMASREDASPDPTLAKAEKAGSDKTVLEEFTPIIHLKRMESENVQVRRRASTVVINDQTKVQLRTYLSNIASMYQDNPFHNFEHASHVVSSVKKLLNRIVNVGEGNSLGKHDSGSSLGLVDLTGHSYGITSDPLTQFAVVFSAIIHDVDHPGVPNAQLVKENTRKAQIYRKSVAEQNSVDLAWEMLMHEDYRELRACIYQTEEDLKRFRQLVVNTVLATDIVDKELQALRKARWETAFSQAESVDDDADTEDRKATIVIEHLIQASDVSHTMQHWHIYKAWNEKFFKECYGAFKAGRADVDPSINWYKGEIGFFDFYIIPLAKKLDNCGVFGVSSHEYLNYATANRDEWVREGEALVATFLKNFHENEKMR
ncbi:unnamed protein product [Cylindrotheca closterium]|uniref:Phosphodiesterase n=1 Tax=Cylindrotheca closterium TaxID=2856 RepID=A0AAD2GA39_9STRA|nr:unnamed protein product [Cylindrotheca closterium]